MDYKPFKLVSAYKPTGDQPQAIEGLVNGLNRGLEAAAQVEDVGVQRADVGRVGLPRRLRHAVHDGPLPGVVPYGLAGPLLGQGHLSRAFHAFGEQFNQLVVNGVDILADVV